MAFMISRETENVKSSEEIESAFRALSSEGKPYVTKEELYQVGPWEGPEFLGITETEGCTPHTVRKPVSAGRTGLAQQLLTYGHVLS